MAAAAAPPQPGRVSPPPLVDDAPLYVFKPRPVSAAEAKDDESKTAPADGAPQGGGLGAGDLEKLLEKSGLTETTANYSRDIDPSMYSLVSYMPGVPATPDTLFPEQAIYAGAAGLSTASDVYTEFRDGNLKVLHGETKLWETDTVGSSGDRFTLHADGTLALEDASGGEIWSARAEDPAAKPPFKCQLRYDGNLAIIDKRNCIVWDTKSFVPHLQQEALRYERETSLYDVSTMQLVSMRAINPLRTTDIQAAFKLQPNPTIGSPPAGPPAKKIRTEPVRAEPTIPGGPPTVQYPADTAAMKKPKKEKKEKKEKKHKKDKEKHKHKSEAMPPTEPPP